MGDGDSFLRSLRSGFPFALGVLLSMGAHAFGHCLVARRHGVDTSFPYFIPAFTMAGSAGAYVEPGWPIEDRKALIRIFAAGPIAGFLMSAGFPMGRCGPSQTTMKVPRGVSFWATPC